MVKSIMKSSDSLGVLASAICVVHCLLTPLLFSVKACVHGHEHTYSWWGLIDVFFLAISLLAVIQTVKEGTYIGVKVGLIIAWIGLAFVIANEYIDLIHISHYVIFLPAITLIGLHLYNHKYCKCDIGCYTSVIN